MPLPKKGSDTAGSKNRGAVRGVEKGYLKKKRDLARKAK